MEFRKDCLMEIYTDSGDQFSVGRYLCESACYVTFRNFDPAGREDGLLVLKRCFIKNVCYETDYLKKMSLYRRYWEDNSSIAMLSKKIADEDVSDLGNLILHACENREMVSLISIKDPDCIYTGFVRSFEDGKVLLEEVSLESAKTFETKTLLLKNIILLECRTMEQKLLSYAHGHMA